MTAYVGEPAIDGRIFYNDDFSGFNFQRTRQTLNQVIEQLFRHESDEKPPTFYVGSTLVDHWLPGFRADNDIDLGGRDSLTSIWLGNRSRIAAHFDFPNNIACVVAGKRRFTLFPPEQADNLYVGPLEFTPSGQPISLVDCGNPDLEKYPNFVHAQAAAISIELGPGDALFIPSMWWHHVESLQPFNVLVNYWWRSTPVYQGSPMNALQHAVMSLRDLPVEQRRVWKDIFERYVFSDDDTAFEHIPEQARGILNEVDEEAANNIRAHLLRMLKA